MTDYLSWSYLWRRAQLDVCKGRRGVSAMLAGLEREAGVQPAPQPNPSPRPQLGRGLGGDVESEPAGLYPQKMKTDPSHHFNCV